MEAHAYSHFLTRTRRYYRCNQCCDFCLATTDKRSPELTWGHLTLKALWRHTMTMTDPQDPSPWTVVPGLAKERRLLDLLHIAHLGTLRDVIASCIIDALEDGSLGHFYGLDGASKNDILHKMSHHAAAWAKAHGMQLYVGTLTMARLGRPLHAHWPFAVLDTRVKAAKCRTLMAFVTFLMSRLAESPALQSQEAKLHAQIRSVCCWSIDVPLSVFSQNRSVKMPVQLVAEVTWLCRLHSAAFQWLAAECLRHRRLLYKVRPKTHYFSHMVDSFESSSICLMHLATFGDEDFMGKCRKICQACHGSTYMLTWSRRYALKRALQWQGLKKATNRWKSPLDF